MHEDNKATVRDTVRTDGKRKVTVGTASYTNEGFDVAICRNGFQTTVVTMDREMLGWLRDAIKEHIGS